MINKSKKLIDTWTPIGHSILCPNHGPFVDIKRHSHNIARFFIFKDSYDSDPIASWFQIASGIKEVIYVSDLYDDLVQWCGPAIDYENAKSGFHSRLIGELTRFNFIWGGFEAFLDTISLPQCPDQRGKINSVNYFLKNNYLNKFPPLDCYSEVQTLLKKMIIKNEWLNDSLDIFSDNNCVSEVNWVKSSL